MSSDLHLSDPRDTLKMIRETLCVAQTALQYLPYEDPREESHRDRIGRIVAEIDRQRPLGSDGKHGDLHTPSCGCEEEGG